MEGSSLRGVQSGTPRVVAPPGKTKTGTPPVKVPASCDEVCAGSYTDYYAPSPERENGKTVMPEGMGVLRADTKTKLDKLVELAKSLDGSPEKYDAFLESVINLREEIKTLSPQQRAILVPMLRDRFYDYLRAGDFVKAGLVMAAFEDTPELNRDHFLPRNEEETTLLRKMSVRMMRFKATHFREEYVDSQKFRFGYEDGNVKIDSDNRWTIAKSKLPKAIRENRDLLGKLFTNPDEKGEKANDEVMLVPKGNIEESKEIAAKEITSPSLRKGFVELLDKSIIRFNCISFALLFMMKVLGSGELRKGEERSIARLGGKTGPDLGDMFAVQLPETETFDNPSQQMGKILRMMLERVKKDGAAFYVCQAYKIDVGTKKPEPTHSFIVVAVPDKNEKDIIYVQVLESNPPQPRAVEFLEKMEKNDSYVRIAMRSLVPDDPAGLLSLFRAGAEGANLPKGQKAL